MSPEYSYTIPIDLFPDKSTDTEIDHDSPPRINTFSMIEFLDKTSSGSRFVVCDQILRGDVTLLAGRTGIGKSFLGLQLCFSVACGLPFLGKTVETGAAVCLSLEDGPDVLRDRISSLQTEHNIQTADLEGRLYLDTFDPNDPDRYVLWRDETETAALMQLESDLTKIKDLSLVLIDTAKLAFQGIITDPQAVRFFLRKMRALAARLNIAIILITHVNRSGDTSGTTEWENHARGLLHIKGHADHFRLEMLKNNYADPMTSISIVRKSNGIWIQRTAAVEKSIESKGITKVKSLAERARQAFLDGLDGTTETLSVNKNSPKGNYAPRRIARMPRARQLRVDQAALESAMSELLAEGVISEVPAPGKHKTMILGRTHDDL